MHVNEYELSIIVFMILRSFTYNRSKREYSLTSNILSEYFFIRDNTTQHNVYIL